MIHHNHDRSEGQGRKHISIYIFSKEMKEDHPTL